jgi:hypothetical protein
LSQWSLGHCAVYALPVPGYSLHLIVFSKAGTPDRNKEAGVHPSHEMGVNRTLAAESFFWQRFPLATGAQNVHDSFEDLPGFHRFFAATRFTSIRFVWVALWSGNQGRNLLPEGIRDFPRLSLCHKILPVNVLNAGRELYQDCY